MSVGINIKPLCDWPDINISLAVFANFMVYRSSGINMYFSQSSLKFYNTRYNLLYFLITIQLCNTKKIAHGEEENDCAKAIT